MPRALASAYCKEDDQAHTATVYVSNFASFEIERIGDYIFLNTPSHEFCGTVTTTDTINIDAGGAEGYIRLSPGPSGFTPGFTTEADATSEIEFNIENAQNLSYISVEGTGSANTFTVGRARIPSTFEYIHVFNLNAGAEAGAPDNDVVIRGATPKELRLVGNGGNDHLKANGTGTLTAGPSWVPVRFETISGEVVGGDADDRIQVRGPKGSADSFSGGAGIDSISYGERTGAVTISLNGAADDGGDCPGLDCEGDNVATDIETLITGDGNDTLIGNGAAQTLDGGKGKNDVFGRGGPDTFVLAGKGPDDARGGRGRDTASYEGRDDGVNVSLDGQPDDGASGEVDNVRADIENVFGTSAADQLYGSDIGNELHGGKGDDVLSGEAGNDVLDGGGYLEAPQMPERDGSDTFFGGGGQDMALEDGHVGALELTLDGVRNDAVVSDPLQGNDNIRTDVEGVTAAAGDDSITGNGKNNVLVGGPGGDDIHGLGGNDKLMPGAGDDTLDGGADDDTVSFAGAAAGIVLDLASGDATGDGTDSLARIERAIGSTFDDELNGSGVANDLFGGIGLDIQRGRGGPDLLAGGPGDDTLDGGAGVDTCKQGGGTGTSTDCEN